MQSKLKLIASLCIFGTISLFVRNIALGSGLIALSRGLLGTVFLLLFLAVRRQNLDLPAIRKNLGILLLSGGIMGLNWALLFEAYRYTTVAVATLCYYMQPVFLTLAAAVLLGEKLSVKKGICILAALCGMILISGVIGGGIPEARELTGMRWDSAPLASTPASSSATKSSRISAPTIKRLSSCSLRRS